MALSSEVRLDTERQVEQIANQETGLARTLSRAQVVMIALGGAIGTGLFAGSSLAIGYAGPAVLISYLIAGFVAAVMVLSLSEMAVAHPAAGSFGVYAETYLNAWAGFIVRYTYWMAQILAIGGEAVAVGVYMNFWFPGSPVWLWSMGFGVALLVINSSSVKNFGTVEYWFTSIKVIAIVVFIVLGLSAVFGVGQAPVGLHNVVGLPGGFMPHGIKGVWMAVIMGLFSYNGIEVIAVTSGETADPAKTIPAALRSMALRLVLFYVLALFIVVAFVPWMSVGSTTMNGSPFVKVFAHSGIWQAAGIMNFVVITAALSGMNTNIYLCSRMLFSLSRGGYAPGFLGRLSKSGSPIAAIIASGVCILIAGAVSKLTPKAYDYLFGIALFGAMTVWIIILLSHLSFRRRHKASELAVRMPGYPIMQIAGVLMIGAVLVTMGLDKDWRLSWIAGVPWLLGLTVAFFIRRALERRARPPAAIEGHATPP
jgi:L-asparagine transporter-like permease